MKQKAILLLCLLTACTAQLSDEQRQKVKDDMAQHRIKKVTEAALTEAAFTLGRSISKQIEKKSLRVDSLQKAERVKIYVLEDNNTSMLEIEKQILEAYQAEANNLQLSDNVQKLSSDTLLYTKPIYKTNLKGTLVFSYALGIRIAKRELVLKMKE